MKHTILLISTVTKEFGSYRIALRQGLERHNLSVKIQENFEATGLETLEKLGPYVQNSDVVVHIVGEHTGSQISPPSLTWIQQQYPDLANRFPVLREVLNGNIPSSYTQWEAYLACYHKKVLLIAVPEYNAVSDNGDYTSAEVLLNKQQQQEHLARLRAMHCHPEIKFNNVDHLIAEIFRSRLLDRIVANRVAEISENKPVKSLINNLPYTTLGSLFKGREAFLQKLHEKFIEEASGKYKALHGLGGIGKTRLAVEYAWQYQNYYSALLIVRARTRAELEANLASLCSLLVPNLAIQNAQEQEVQFNAALEWLNQHSGWLLIIDNVDTLEAASAVERWLPRLINGHVLITTRVREWSQQIECLELDLINEVDATSFLLERTDGRRYTSTDPEDALSLACELGCLALALEQAGAYIKAKHITIQEYSIRWISNRKAVWEWFDERLMGYSSSVAVTWQTSFDQLTLEAQTLLKFLSWLAAAPIPLSLLQVPILNYIQLDTEEALVDLARYSLVTYTADGEAFGIHQLVQDVTRSRLEGEFRYNNFSQALNWVYDHFEGVGDPSDVRNWPVMDQLRPHALDLVIEYAPEFNNPEPTAYLLGNLGQLMHSKAELSQAELLLRRALLILEQRYSIDHPAVAISINQLASLLTAKNDYEEAELLLRRILPIIEKNNGPNHPSVGMCLNNTAHLLHLINRAEEAEPLYRRALKIKEDSLGSNHPSVGTTLNELASLLKDTNRSDEAEVMYGRAIKIAKQNYSSDQISEATYTNNLALLLKEKGRYNEAEPLYREALQIQEQNLGFNHPAVGTTLGNIARLLQDTNRLIEAEPLLLRALTIAENSYGPDHTEVARCINNIALLLKAKKQFGEAELLYRKAMHIQERVLGPDHPTIAISLNNIAKLMRDTNRMKEAKPLFGQVITIFLAFFKSTGHTHPFYY